MKKLSLSSVTNNSPRFVYKGEVGLRTYKDGFSFVEIDGEEIVGSCMSCSEHYCMTYTESEIFNEDFAEFPKNGSKRVCPTDAISFDNENGLAKINESQCIVCGLCLYRCPFSAIQLSVKHSSCTINGRNNNCVECSDVEQRQYIARLIRATKHIEFDNIPISFSENYKSNLSKSSRKFPDLSEIVVRNTLVNSKIRCQTNASGNNHIRIEFLSKVDGTILMGESEVSCIETSRGRDTLSVNRRILDNLAVLIGRYGFDKSNIIPISIINGLPNKRTDYYEVVEDINKILNVKIFTLTYHILFVLNLFSISFSLDMIKSFYITRSGDELVLAMKRLIPNIASIDSSIDGDGYRPVK